MKKAKEDYEARKAKLIEKDMQLKKQNEEQSPLIYVIPICIILILTAIAYTKPQWLTFGKSNKAIDL